MESKAHVWIRERSLKSGKTVYDLRYIDLTSGKWKSRAVDGDQKHALREAATLEAELDRGTHQDLKKTAWSAFVDEHLRLIPGDEHRKQAKVALDSFGAMYDVPPHRIRFGMVEAWVSEMRARKNKPATINKKVRYLNGAFNAALRRGYLVRNPLTGWRWEKEAEKKIRTCSRDEEAALLATAETLYGKLERCFIHTALHTGCRKGELVKLRWDNVDLDGAAVTFTDTKTRVDRTVPLTPETVQGLRDLLSESAHIRGPFATLTERSAGRRFRRIVKKSGLPSLTLHDLRRSYATRLIAAGVPLPTVQRLTGHKKLAILVRYYAAVTDDDLRAAVAKLSPSAGAG